ncbi:MAG: hypothetical protein NPIRA05_13550 [Nitrospirales bacterium]|nr:MAG: hypothetical protein NPIRA05_13550 [Nitrospirales bacterium]
MEAIDKRAGQFMNRSGCIEIAVRSFLATIAREEQNAKDLAIISRRAGQFNKEAADVLAYQVIS